MSKEKRLVPELRFPEFEYEYDKKKIKNISNTENVAVILNKGDYYVSTEDMEKDFGGIFYNQVIEEKRSNKIQKGDILISNIRPYLRKIEISEHDGGCSSDILSLTPKKVNNYYLLSYLRSDRFINHFIGTSKGTKMPRGDKKSIYNFLVYLPNLQEQQKIATFLSLIDKKIELLEKKVELLEEHKRGLLQKVFSQEIRFKKDDGSEFEEWGVKRLEDVAIIEKGKQLGKIDMIESGKYYVLNGGKSLSGFTNKYNAFENTISISEGGESCGFVSYNNEKFWAGGHLYVLKNLTINVGFLYQYLKFEESRIMRLRVGSGLPNIQKGPLAAYRIYEPSLLEQLKITEFLSIYDSVVDYTKYKLRKTNEFKKGLLQKMFV